MISIYIEATDTNGKKIIGDHYQFKTVPRAGERLVLDNRGGMTEVDSAMPLRVMEVINYAEPKGDVMNPISYIELYCKVVG